MQKCVGWKTHHKKGLSVGMKSARLLFFFFYTFLSSALFFFYHWKKLVWLCDELASLGSLGNQ